MLKEGNVTLKNGSTVKYVAEFNSGYSHIIADDQGGIK